MAISSVTPLCNHQYTYISQDEKSISSGLNQINISNATTVLQKRAIDSVKLEKLWRFYLTLHHGKDHGGIPDSLNHEEGIIGLIFKDIFSSYASMDWEKIDKEFLLELQDSFGMQIVFAVIREGSKECLLTLMRELSHAHFTDLKDASGRSALHLAAIYGKEEMLEGLLKEGLASCEAKDSLGLTPLHWAIHEGHPRVVKILLLQHGLSGQAWRRDPHCSISTLALAAASGYPDIFALLLEHDAFKELNVIEGISNWGTLLHLAIQCNQPLILKHLLECEHKSVASLLEHKDGEGRTPLQLAAFLGDCFAIKSLIDKGCLIHQGEMNLNGVALHFAVRGEKPEAISLLLSLGSDCSKVDEKGRAPLALLNEQETLSPAAGKCKNILENYQRSERLEKITPADFKKMPPFNLIFEGNYDGKRAFVESIKALESKKILKGIRRFSGSGMGGLISTLLSVGYSSSQIEGLSFDSFETLFEKRNPGPLVGEIEQIRRLCNPSYPEEDPHFTYSLCDEEKLKQQIEEWIKSHTTASFLTLGELAEKVSSKPDHYKHLHLPLFSLKAQKVLDVSSEDMRYKELIISDVVAATLAFPGIFKLASLRRKNQEGMLYLDESLGKLIAPFLETSLIDLFDDESYQEDPYFKGRQTNYRTVSFAFNQSEEISSSDQENGASNPLLLDLIQKYQTPQRRPIPESISRGRIHSFTCSQESLDPERKLFSSIEAIFSSSKEIEPLSRCALTALSSKEITPRKYDIFLHSFQTPVYQETTSLKRYDKIPELPVTFISREIELEKITSHFQSGSKLALSGLGGVGKSTLSISYARESKSHYAFVMFIKLIGETTFIQELVELAISFNIKEKREEDTLRALKVFLGKMATPYLFILDGVDHLASFTGIEKYLPNSSQCKILITTRLNSDAEVRGFKLISVKSFSSNQAVDYLLQGAQDRCDREQKAAFNISSLLGHLPLALTHVRRYVHEQKCSLEYYKTLFDQYHLRLFKEGQFSLQEEEQTILTTWNISLDAIKQKDHGTLAINMMKGMACLGKGAISFTLLLEGAKLLEEDELSLRSALKHLMNYSLIEQERNPKSDTTFYHMHDLVHDCIYSQIEEGEKAWITLKLEEALMKEAESLAERDQYDRHSFTSCIFHAEHFLSEEKNLKYTELEDKADFFRNLSSLCFELTLFSKALSYSQKELKIAQKLCGKKSIAVAECYERMADSLQNLGRDQEALQMAGQALRIKLSVGVEDLLDFIQSYEQIGEILSKLGKSQVARKYFQTALDLKKNIEEGDGIDHKDLLIAEGYEKIATAFKESGDYQEALESASQALQMKQKLCLEESYEMAENHIVTAQILEELGHHQKALEKAQKALTIWKKTSGEESINTAEGYQLNGAILASLGREKEALEMSKRALYIKKELFGEESIDVAESLQQLGEVFTQFRKYDQALEMSQKALSMMLTMDALGEKSPYSAEAYQQVGSVLQGQGRYEEALENYQNGLAIWQNTYGEESLYTAESYKQIGTILHDLNRDKEGIEYIQKGLDMKLKLLSPCSLELADWYTVMGDVLYDLQQFEKALEHYERALVIQRKVYGEDSIKVAETYFSIARVLNDLTLYEKALNMGRKSLHIICHIEEEDLEGKVQNYQFAGDILDNLERYNEALAHYQKALEISQEFLNAQHLTYGEKSWQVAESYKLQVALFQELGEHQKAFEMLYKALEIECTLYGENSYLTAESYELLIGLLQDAGRYEEALKISQRVLDIKLQKYGEDFIDTVEEYKALGEIFQGLGLYQKALNHAHHALNIQHKVYEEGSIHTVESYQLLGSILQDKECYEEALDIYQKGMDIQLNQGRENTIDIAESYHQIGDVLYNLSRYTESLESYQKALNISSLVLGEDSFHTAMGHQEIASVLQALGQDEEALQKTQIAFNISQKREQEESLYIAQFYEKRGEILFDFEDYQEALIAAQRALKIKQSILGEYSHYTAENYDLLAAILFEQENYMEAFIMSNKGIAIREKLGNYSSLPKADNYQMLAKISHVLGKNQERINYLQKELILRKEIHRSIFDSSWDEESVKQEASALSRGQIDAQENQQDLRDLKRKESFCHIQQLTQILEATHNALQELQSIREIEGRAQESNTPLCVIT
ncbi:tetratricopeptide repeat protein [Rhabdochlamydiaceae symbiont of Dictyostelium giganteum]|uniref:tetratricopeptide repeat protein n=1 Tax=Rhabdochlamydiaceae symbiont of Dictyostelium giganteum TaxID=3342349 RepID=UPI00384F76BE